MGNGSTDVKNVMTQDLLDIKSDFSRTKAATDQKSLSKQPETVEHVPELIEQLVTDFYKNDLSLFDERVTPDCIFIGTVNTCNGEIADVKTEKHRQSTPQMKIKDFRTLRVFYDQDNPDNIVFVGTYKVFSAPELQLLISDLQRITVCLRRIEDRWLAYHVHVSNEWDKLESDEYFPFKLGTHTYEYVRDILRAGNKVGIIPNRVALKFGDSHKLIDPKQIIYIQAHSKQCDIHCVDEQFAIPSILKKIAQQLPGIFIRTHRSYLVNAAHISDIERYTITMSDGTRLPIPERRFDEVCKEIYIKTSAAPDYRA